MAITAEQEKQKVAFPEIVDDLQDTAYAESGQAAAQMPEQEAGSDAAAQMPTQETASEGTEAEDNDVSIDVDIDNMVWEVDTEPADSAEAEDVYSEEVYESTNEQENREWYGNTNGEFEEIEYSRKMNKHLFTWVLSLVCGMYGVDRFARGQVGLGIAKLLTFGGFGFWYMADLAVAIYKSYMAPDAMQQEDLHFDSFGRYV
jgi:hypothetical protein